MKQKIKDRNGRERIIDDRSLENLKLGPIFRDQGKQRFNTTLRPEHKWQCLKVSRLLLS
jgi:hypothetical protein